MKRFCRRVEPGEGRLADCLGEQLEEEEEGDDEGEGLGLCLLPDVD